MHTEKFPNLCELFSVHDGRIDSFPGDARVPLWITAGDQLLHPREQESDGLRLLPVSTSRSRRQTQVNARRLWTAFQEMLPVDY